MVSEQEKAWMAAILECGDYLDFFSGPKSSSQKDQGPIFTQIVVHVSSSNPYLIREVSEIWKRIGMIFHFIWTKGRNGSPDIMTIRCDSVRSSKKLLEAVRPYIVSKKPEVDILLEYANYRERLIKEREAEGRYKDVIDRDYVNKLMTAFKAAKNQKYDMSRVSRKANEVLDLSELRSSETLCETPDGEDKVRTTTEVVDN